PARVGVPASAATTRSSPSATAASSSRAAAPAAPSPSATEACSTTARIRVRAGRGGDGGLSFRREKHVPKGGPDGGDGGPGGDVVLVADPDLRDLSAFRPNQHVKAGRGGRGGGALKHGVSGDDAELHVPVGTQVLDEHAQLLADLAHGGARADVARGG